MVVETQSYGEEYEVDDNLIKMWRDAKKEFVDLNKRVLDVMYPNQNRYVD